MKLFSSWIRSVLYRNGYLAVFLKPDDRKSSPVALLYSNVPPYLPGLIQAGEGGRSVGSAFNSLLKRKDVQKKYGIEYQRIEGQDKVRELKEMMTK